MATAIRIKDDIYLAAQRVAGAEHRSIPQQIEFWALIGKTALENPDLFPVAGRRANLVSMTRLSHRSISKPVSRRTPKPGSRRWPLQDAKARFSELVRRVRSDGPQHVTVHGRDEVVVLAAEEFRRLKGNLTGQVLIDALRSSPRRKTDLAPGRAPMPVRDVSL